MKWIVELAILAVFLLLLGFIASYCPSQVGKKEKTITVCSSGCDFKIIQEALNNASEGYKVLVTDSAVYNEELNIPHDGVTLDCNGATINGTEYMINGFIRTRGQGVLSRYKSQVAIKNCKIQNFDYGIMFALSNDSILDSNIVESNYAGGISVGGSDNITVVKNIVRYNIYNGIDLDRSNNNMIADNVLTQNDMNGINLASSQNNTVINNVIESNQDGFSLFWSQHNMIVNNKVKSNKRYGTFIFYSNINTLNDNVVCDNPEMDFYCFNSTNEFENNVCSTNNCELNCGAC